MATPSSSVFDTYELLEHILLHLPVKDLFVLQRVTSTWRDLIVRSVKLRKYMFMLADHGGPLATRSDEDAAIFNGPIVLHPFLRPYCDELFCSGEPADNLDISVGRGWPQYSGHSVQFVVRIAFTTLSDGAAALRDAFLTQPPITTITHLENVGLPLDFKRLQFPNGATFGDLANIEARRAYHQCFFSVSDASTSREGAGEDEPTKEEEEEEEEENFGACPTCAFIKSITTC